MSRVDGERDAKKADETKRAEEKRQKVLSEEKRQEFRRLIDAKQRQHHETRRQDTAQTRHDEQLTDGSNRAKAYNRLLIRQGIASTKFGHMLEQTGVQRGEMHRAEVLRRHDDERLQHEMSGVPGRDDNSLAKKPTSDPLAPIERDDRGTGGNGGSHTGGDGANDGQSQQGSDDRPAALLEALARPDAPTAGHPPSVASAGGASPMHAARQAAIELANKLAERMAVGFDAKGLATAHIQLQQGVLAGSRLHVVRGGHGGLSVTFFTDNKDVARLVGALSTRQELQRQLESKGIALDSLAVEQSVA